jgi:hypothetical protein
MIVLAFFSWWYGRGWREAVQSFAKRIAKVNQAFSIHILLKTLFSPWRRIITHPGASIGNHVRAWGDNIVSRTVGFIVRLLALLAALAMVIVVSILSIVELIIWPLLPLAIVVCLILGAVR